MGRNIAKRQALRDIAEQKKLESLRNHKPPQTRDNPLDHAQAIWAPMRRGLLSCVPFPAAFKPLKSASVTKIQLTLAKLAFCRYALPPTLHQIWLQDHFSPMEVENRRPGVNVRVDSSSIFRKTSFQNQYFWKHCYVALGQGASFLKWFNAAITEEIHARTHGQPRETLSSARAAEVADVNAMKLTRKEAHWFTTCPHPIPPNIAYIWAIAKAAGASDSIAHAISRASFHITTHTPLVLQAVRFFAGHPSMAMTHTTSSHRKNSHYTPCSRTFDEVYDYVRARRQEQSSYDFANKHWSTLCTQTQEWHRHLARVKDLSGSSWQGFDIPDKEWPVSSITEKGTQTFVVFRQILTGAHLAEEGRTQRHCVSSYKNRCANGSISIWSMTYEVRDNVNTEYPVVRTSKKALTIELSQNYRVDQARGLANRNPTTAEANDLARWKRSLP